MIWFDLFGSQSPRLVEHSSSARMNWDLNKVIIVIINLLRADKLQENSNMCKRNSKYANNYTNKGLSKDRIEYKLNSVTYHQGPTKVKEGEREIFS